MSVHKIEFKEEQNLVTNFGNPDTVIETMYGSITRLEWQKLEVERIGNCSIILHNGLTAIIRGDKIKHNCSTKEALKENSLIKRG